MYANGRARLIQSTSNMLEVSSPQCPQKKRGTVVVGLGRAELVDTSVCLVGEGSGS